MPKAKKEIKKQVQKKTLLKKPVKPLILKKERRLITAALPYVNYVPHIGHIVGCHLPADIFARYSRLQGHHAVFIGGTDEHGTATEVAAQKAGITPGELCDFYYKIHKEIYNWFDFSYDNFSRTSRPIHYETTREFFLKIYKNGYVKEHMIKIPFCNNCKRALADRYINGTCPKCKYENARGDQCEKCSSLLLPAELLKPRCSTCNLSDISFINKKHLFLELNKLSKKLESWIKLNNNLRPQVKSLALGWIKEGLKPRDITRDLKWGIPVPLKGYESSVFYVWFDAPIGYISSTKERFPKHWEEYWKNPKARIYNFIGKDNIPFHTIFFPGMLMANEDYTLPFNVIGLQYLNFGKSKISKSRQYGIFCDNLVKAGLEPDYWRFYLSYIIPETKDTEFIWNDFQLRINSDLIGNFSNFINRTLKFIYNQNNKEIIQTDIDARFKEQIDSHINLILDAYEKVELRKALTEILKLSDLGNKYFDAKKIWHTRDSQALFMCVNLCKVLGLLMHPFLPATSKKILHMLNCQENDFSKINDFNLEGKIKEPHILFRILDNKDINYLKEITARVNEYFPGKKEEQKMENAVDFKEFQKLDIRVGTIIEAKLHPNADKLIVLKVDFGTEQRQLVAALRQFYKDQELVGKQITVVMNLKPVALRGIESKGMLLAAEDSEGKVVLVTPEKKVLDNAKVS